MNKYPQRQCIYIYICIYLFGYPGSICWTGLADRLEGRRVRVRARKKSGHVSSRGPPSRSPWPGRDEGVANAATTSSLSLCLSLSRIELEAHRSADQLPEPRSNICPRKNKSPLSLTTGRASLVSKRALFNRRRITDPESPVHSGPRSSMSRFSSLRFLGLTFFSLSLSLSHFLPSICS